MNRSKKIFLILAAVFFVVMAAIGIDISRKTTFPGSKGYLKESVMSTGSGNEKDVEADTTKTKD